MHSKQPSPNGPASPLLPLITEYLPPAALMLFFLRACYAHSLANNFWLDEILSYLFVSDPSLAHMMAANQDIINTTPPLYFLLGWGWFHLFSGTELSLRLLTSLLLCATVGVTWRVLRPRYGFLPATIGLYAGFSAPELLVQNNDVRFYTLFLLTSAVVLWQYDRLFRDPHGAPAGWWPYFVNSLAHAALIFTHSFGLMYSGCLVLAHLLRCVRRQQRPDGRFLLSVVLAWVAFVILWGRVFLHHLGAFRPYSWIPRPTAAEGVANLYVASPWVLLAVAGAAIVFFAGRLFSMKRAKEAAKNIEAGGENTTNALHLPLAAGVLIALPVPFIYLVSQIGPSCFLPRYFLPLSIAWAVLLAFLWDKALLDRFLGQDKQNKPLRTLNTIVSVGAFAFLLFQLISISRISAAAAASPAPVTPAAEAEFILSKAGAPADLPVVFTSSHRFNTSFFYARKPSRFYYVVDKDYALHSGSGTAYNYVVQLEQANVAKYYPAQNTVDVQEFLRSHPRFLVFDDAIGTNPGTPRWQEYRLGSDPSFSVTPLPVPRELSHVFSLLLVEKK